MKLGLNIYLSDPDEDYLGLDIFVATSRYSGATFVYAGLNELIVLADKLTGFPRNGKDEVSHEFGQKWPGANFGYCKLRFHCLDGSGHVGVDVQVVDDGGHYEQATAQLTIGPVVASGIDAFVEQLRTMQERRVGEASIPIWNG